MDALILSCGTGGGHDTAAKALLEEFQRRGHHVQMLNPYTLKGERLANHINQAYIKLARNAPTLFGAVYKLGSAWHKVPFKSPVYTLNARMIPVMEEFFAEHHFDVVINTHLFPLEILTNMKRQGKEVPPYIMVATDYTCQPLMDEVDCNAFVIPTEDLIPEFVGYNIPPEKLYPYGIPVKQGFSSEMSREEARRQLGLEEDKRYILMAGGSFGAGKIVRTIDRLIRHFEDQPDTKLIVICGNNEKLYEDLRKKYGDKIIAVGFTEKMSLFLKACDLYITKPGGLSSTEAAVSGIPLIMMEPIPGCETCNLQYYEERGMSLPIGQTDDELIQSIDELSNSEVCSAMMENQRQYINRSAAQDVCNLAERICM